MHEKRIQSDGNPKTGKSPIVSEYSVLLSNSLIDVTRHMGVYEIRRTSYFRISQNEFERIIVGHCVVRTSSDDDLHTTKKYKWSKIILVISKDSCTCDTTSEQEIRSADVPTGFLHDTCDVTSPTRENKEKDQHAPRFGQ